MKNYYLLVIAFLISTLSFAQTDGLSYQAVILNPNSQELPGVDATNNILPNTQVALRFTIFNDSGSTVYQETQTTTTDAYGLVNLFIGEGNQTSDNSFQEIEWDGEPKSLQVDIDFNGGSNYVSLGNQKLTFVPYAYHRNINATGNLSVDGLTTFNGDFIVEGITTFNNDLIIEGVLALNNDLNVTGNSTFDGNTLITGTLGVQGTTSLDDELTVQGDTNLNSNLSVNGNSNMGGNTSISGSLTVQGATSLGNDLSVEGISNFNNDLNVINQHPTNLSGTLTVDGLTTFNNGLVIEGETIINDNLTVTGNVLIEGDSELLGSSIVRENLVVQGITNLQDILKVDNASATFLTGELNVDGISNLNNDLNVQGVTNLEDEFNVNNASTSNLSGELNVIGVSNLKDNLNVQGVTNLEDEFNVNNGSTSNLSGELNVDGVSNLNNNLNVQGVTNLEDEFNVNNASTSNLSGELNVDGISNLNDNLNVQGVTNLESEFNVNNASVSNLSGILNVDGISNLNNELNVSGVSNLNNDLFVTGNTRLENELYVVNKATLADSLHVNGSTLLSNLVVRGGNEVAGTNANHIALFENTNTSSVSDGIAIRIHGNASNKIGYRNRFITFYSSANGGDYMAGRIESYDLLAGDLWESFPIPDFANLINVFDFSQVLEWTPPSLSFNPGSLPSSSGGLLPSLSGGSLPTASFYPGRLPSLSIDWTNFSFNFNRGRLPSLTFNSGSFPTLNPGSFPTLNPGSLPTANFDIGTLNLNFDGFFNPTAATTAQNDITAMVAWGMRNGDPGFIPTSPTKIVLASLILAAKQVARDQGVIYGSKGADYAEWLEKENPEEKYMFGEVVGVKGGKISRNTTDADQVMSISLAPIVLGNMPNPSKKDHFEKVGFMGQVPVLTLGDVNIGDYIVASGYNDGYAKAIHADDLKLEDLKQIIGRAWSSSNGAKASIINVSVGLKTNEWVEILKQQESKMNQMEMKIKKLESLTERMEKLETKLNNLELN